MRIECRYIVLKLTVDILTISLYTINVMLHTAVFCDDVSVRATRQDNNLPFFSNNPKGLRQTANFNIEAMCHAVGHCKMSNTQSILGLLFSDNVRQWGGGEVRYYVDQVGISEFKGVGIWDFHCYSRTTEGFASQGHFLSHA